MGLLAKKKEIGPDTIIQRRNDLLFNEIDGEVVMLSIENGEYYGMDKVGSRIWALLEKPISMENLVNKLMEEFFVTKDKCASDVLVFINKMTNKGLITFI